MIFVRFYTCQDKKKSIGVGGRHPRHHVWACHCCQRGECAYCGTRQGHNSQQQSKSK